MAAGHTSRVGRTRVKIRRGAAPRVSNQEGSPYGAQAPPQGAPFSACEPTWPDLSPGASLTVDPSRPPPTTAQRPFCDWPPGAQVSSEPEGCSGVPPQPRLSNAGRLQARMLARQGRARTGGSSVRAIPHCRDATCCSMHCTDTYKSNSFMWKSCMKACKALNRIGKPFRGRLRNQRLATRVAARPRPRCGEPCSAGCLQGCSIKHCDQPNSGQAGYCGTDAFKKYVHCAAACIKANGGSGSGSSPDVFGRRTGSAMRPRNDDCDEGCLDKCSAGCVGKFPNDTAAQVLCLSACIKGAEGGASLPGRSRRRHNQGLRFARTAEAIVDLVGRGSR